jgi:hypothetical protein
MAGYKDLIFGMVFAGVILMSLITPFASMLSSQGIDNSTVVEMERLNKIAKFSNVTEDFQDFIQNSGTSELTLWDQLTLTSKGILAGIGAFLTALPTYIEFAMSVDYYLGLPDYLFEAILIIITITIGIMVASYMLGRSVKDE